MEVYIVVHNDPHSERSGDVCIRGVYATEAAAQAALPEKETHRGLYQSDGHDADCCAVEEWDVHAIPLTDPPHGD